MKKLLTLIPVLTLLTVTIGCKSVPNLGGIAYLTSYSGASVDLNKHMDHCTNYVAVIGNLSILDNASVYDLGSFTKALEPLPIKQLDGPNGTLIVGGSAFLFSIAGANLLGTNQPVFVKPILQGTKTGLLQAVTEHGCK